jgi:type VI protein secretion system component Hcp
MTRPIKSIWLFLLGILGLHARSAFADSDVLCISAAPGDSTVVAGCIDVLSWSWGASNSALTGTPVNISLSDINFAKQADSASAPLFSLLVTGKTFTAQYSQFKDCCLATPYLTIHFSGAFLSSLQSSASTERPTESMSLSYNAVSYCYTPPAGTAQCSAYSKTAGVIPAF